MLKALISVVALAAAIAPLSARAQSLQDLRSRDAEENALSREAAYTAEVCGAPIAASIDWASAASWATGGSLAEACDGALGAVETMCRQGRKELVKSFVCAGDGSGASLSGKTLRYGARPGVNGFDLTLAVLESAR